MHRTSFGQKRTFAIVLLNVTGNRSIVAAIWDFALRGSFSLVFSCFVSSVDLVGSNSSATIVAFCPINVHGVPFTCPGHLTQSRYWGEVSMNKIRKSQSLILLVPVCS